MRLPRTIKVLSLLAVALIGFQGASAGPAQPVLDAKVVDAVFPPRQGEFPSVDFGRSARPGDDRRGTTEWTIVDSTGNCCENYLTSDASGRIMDFGGSYINYTDDRGKTWKSVRPITPLINGEGAIAMAPGGDVVGVEWDPYTGDHLLAFKYEASEKKWIYTEMPIHAPFYDREWIASVPGPFNIDGKKVPYISFIKGAYPSKEAWFYSTDGINYDRVSSKFLDQTLAVSQGNGVTTLKTAGHPEADWLQPNTNGGITPLGNGWALASPDVPFGGGDWAVFNPETLRWEGYYPKGGAKGRYQVDSAGRLHNVVGKDKEFIYRISSDGGNSWNTLNVPLPEGHRIEEIDFRANRKVGVAAVAIHGHDKKTGSDVDMLFKFDITGAKARYERYHQVGLGDVNGSSGVGASVRFDFETITILPDGRVAMSFYDTTTAQGGRVRPALAIEGDSNF